MKNLVLLLIISVVIGFLYLQIKFPIHAVMTNETISFPEHPVINITPPILIPESEQEKPPSDPLKPDYIPELRPFKINKDLDIWKSNDPQSYIIPNNEWAKYYASLLYVDQNGYVRYTNSRTENMFEDRLFINDYFTDDQLNHFPADGDLWQNPDYYLSHELKGDCEDFSSALTSILISKNIPAKTVFGYYLETRIRHAWTEYEINGKKFIAHSPGIITSPINEKKMWSITEYIPYEENKKDFVPLFEFTDKYFKKV